MFFTRFKKRRAIKSYRQTLPHLLAKDFGKTSTYSPEQVRQTIERHRLNTDYTCYGIALYCTHHEFDRYHRETGEQCDYHTICSALNSDYPQDITDSAFTDYSSSTDTGSFSDGGDSGSGD